jgi:hypothetical protein
MKDRIASIAQASHTGVTTNLLAVEVIESKSLWQPDL